MANESERRGVGEGSDANGWRADGKRVRRRSFCGERMPKPSKGRSMAKAICYTVVR